jgi:shikimate dehydrogenase
MRAGLRAAVLGSPIAHSLSPALHRAAYAELDLDWTYEAIDVPAGGLATFLDGLDEGWAGLSLTMPLKQEALAIARMTSATAREAAAANTLVPLGSGWSAENTDVPGLLGALTEAGVAGVTRATVLGSGATAWSAVVALVRAGVTDLTICARNETAAAGLRAQLGSPVVARTVPWGSAEALAGPLVVSTLPGGAADGFVDLVPAGPGVLFDVAYDPWPSVLATGWSSAGGQVIGGLDLLVHQAVLQVELMSGRRPSVATLRAAGLAALASR